jgi:CBS domain-containing protein
MTEGSTSIIDSLEGLPVVEAMHPGLITCSLDTPLRTVARVMATYRVHAVVVTAHGEAALPGGGVWGVVSDTDVLHAAEAGGLEEPASAFAKTPVLAVTTSDTVACAARRLLEHGVSHLVVVEPRSARPVGVLSTLDVARAVAGFPERHPVGEGARAVAAYGR